MFSDSHYTRPPDAPLMAALGVPSADDWLGGGLKSDGLHEVFAPQNASVGMPSANALSFALLLGWLKRKQDHRPLIWIRAGRPGNARHRDLPYAPGLHDLGLDPAAITLLILPDAKAVLRAGLDSVRDGSAAAVLIELQGRQKLLDLTASRRLAVAAAGTGSMVVLARSGAEPEPSAAHTRWRAASAPSLPLAANAPGRPAFALDLLRNRAGREGLHIILEWDREAASFKQQGERSSSAPLPLSVSAVAGSRAGDAERDRAA